jgi:hypothetical protein
MSDLIWVLPRDKASTLGEFGVSSTYILPRAHVEMSASDVINKFIWVLLRGENDRLVLVVKVHEVDIILDGYYKDDFLLKPDLRNSLRVGSTFNQLNSFVTDISATASVGISEISLTDVKKLTLLLKKNTAVRLTPPSNKALANFIVENPPKNQGLLARLVTHIVVSSSNFSDIWCNGLHKRFRTAPYASIAKAYIERNFPLINLPEIEDLLINSDPYVSILNRKLYFSEEVKITKTLSRAPRVDVIFKTLDPNNIFSREFSSVQLSTLNLIDQIKKTEAAECRHQEILRDISRYLIAEGIQPFQSDSVDLACILRNTLHIFEIKTSNLENAVSQASKGAFQLACYKKSLTTEYESITISLLLEDTGSADLNAFIFETMQVLGIETYFYYDEIAWPHRLKNFSLQLNVSKKSDQ